MIVPLLNLPFSSRVMAAQSSALFHFGCLIRGYLTLGDSKWMQLISINHLVGKIKQQWHGTEDHRLYIKPLPHTSISVGSVLRWLMTDSFSYDIWHCCSFYILYSCYRFQLETYPGFFSLSFFLSFFFEQINCNRVSPGCYLPMHVFWFFFPAARRCWQQFRVNKFFFRRVVLEKIFHGRNYRVKRGENSKNTAEYAPEAGKYSGINILNSSVIYYINFISLYHYFVVLCQ